MNLKSFLNKFKRKKESPPADDSIYTLHETVRDIDSDPFLHSLANLTPDDIAPPKPKKKLTMSELISNVVRYAIIAVCSCVFISSAATLVQSLVDYQRGDDLYGSLSENIFESDLSGSGSRAVSLSQQSRANPALPDYYTNLTADASELDELYAEESYNVKFEQMKTNLTYLQSINPDIFGYIHIDGTNISYPIVQSDDNEWYLDHAYTGEYMVVGSIFADYRASGNMDYNRNTVFYGHNMKDGNMFNNVMNFLDEETFNTKLIEIYTFDGIYYYEPFAIFQTISTYQYFRMYFASDEDFVSFCEEMQSNSNFNKNFTFTGEDQVITLSTCLNDIAGVGRYALHAKLVKVER